MKNIFTEENIGKAVRFLIIIAGGLAVIGGCFFLSHHGYASPDYRIFKGEPHNLTTLCAIARSAASFNPLGIIQLGVLILIGIPLFRVVLSQISFLLKKDYLYTVISSIVLLILLISLFHGKI